MASTVQVRSLSDLAGARRGALFAYRWLLLAFLLADGAQIFLAGFGELIVLCGGPHALDGLLVLGIAGFLYASDRRWRSRMAGS
jgi:hypothetical protein